MFVSCKPLTSILVLYIGSAEQLFVRLSGMFIRKPARDDDIVDRLQHTATLVLLLVFAGGTALQEYVGEPINCWTPTAYPQEHYTEHVNGYCWTHPLRYPSSIDETSFSGADAEEILSKRLVNFGTAFYRWVTLIFVLQAVLFKFPCVVWNYLNRRSGASLTKLRDLLTEAQLNKQERSAKMDEAAKYLHSWLAAYRTPAPRKLFGREIGKFACLFQSCGRRSGKYLCVVYLSVKVLYLLNVIGNFILLTVFLDADFWRYGITVLSDVIASGDWRDPVNFPRLLLCDFRLHEETIVQANPITKNASINQAINSKVITVQCVLSINTILEKLFVVQWFWLVLLAILTIATFVTWSLRTVCACAPYLFARKYMKALMCRDKNGEDTVRSGRRFVRSYLRQDGMFVLRMVAANSDPMVVRELVQHLWDNFQARDVSYSMELTNMETEEQEEHDQLSTKVLKANEETVCDV